jgi:hypothetical protein
LWWGLLVLISGLDGRASSGIDPASKYAWAENAGWVNAAAASTNGMVLRFDGTTGFFSGYAWGENIGWINIGSSSGGPYSNDNATNWGVNMDAQGCLSGYAWGENVGWINFAPTGGGVTIDLATGRFDGHAWGENIGWIGFRGDIPGFGVRTLACDTQPQGTPNWWLDHFGVTEDDDEGDAVPAWMEYIADTDPTDAESLFRVLGVTVSDSVSVVFPSSARRFYTLECEASLSTNLWRGVAGQTNVRGSEGLGRLVGVPASTQQFYRVRVTVSP